MSTPMVECYRNLHNGKISIKCSKTKLVLGHADEVQLRNPKFIVNENGRQRVLREKQKNVHAVVKGVPKSFTGFEIRTRNAVQATSVLFYLQKPVEYKFDFKVTYNPYRYNSFVKVLTEEPITSYTSCCIKSTGEILC